MNDKILMKNSIQKLKKGKETMFLGPKERRMIENACKKESISYNVFSLYEEADKVILYKEKLPVTLFQIEGKETLTHREILGSLFALGLDPRVYGDIVVEEYAYIVILKTMEEFLWSHLTKVGKKEVSLKELPLNTLQDYKRKYEEIEIKVSSFRLDQILSKLTHQSRSGIEEALKRKEVFLNYEETDKGTRLLKEHDIFSIRHYGKYRFEKVLRISKKGDFYLLILKYI